MVYRIGSIACLILLIIMFLVTVVVFFTKSGRKEKILYIRGFKKGQCVAVYVPAILLYWMGLCYGGAALWSGLFNAITTTASLLVLDYNTECVEVLLREEIWYARALYVCFALVLLNALMFVLSLTIQGLWEWWQRKRVRFTRKNQLILVGNNPENVAIYKSDKTHKKLILEDVTNKDSANLAVEKEQLYLEQVASCFSYTINEEIEKMLDRVLRHDRECVFVINTLDDKKNIALCRTILAVMDQSFGDADEQQRKKLEKKLRKKLKVFVFGDPRYEAIYLDIVKAASGCIHYVNKYLKVAMDFVDRYPFSVFLDEKQLDYETSLIKENVDINAILIGFGRTNQQIFLTSVANNQFVTGTEDDPELKKVKYYIFDKENSENNKNLNHTYYRYKNECCDKNGNFILDKEAYLPQPVLPAEESYHHLDINDCEFYNQIRSVVTRNANDMNFVVISFGTDLENLDMAQKLVEKRREWGLSNLIIFVKIRAWHKEDTFLEDEDCYFIGHEQDVLLDIEKIMGDDMFHMAQMRNEVYELEYAIAHAAGNKIEEQKLAELAETANDNWYTVKTPLERESSLYCCLSLRSKLNMMGLDYCKGESTDADALSEEAYLQHYAGDDLPDTTQYTTKVNEKAIITYPLNFKQSRRRTMAIHEHLRWNSFMLSKGVIPASKERIYNEKVMKGDKLKYSNGKNYELRRHGNITTFDGLVEFRKLVAVRNKRDQLEKDGTPCKELYWDREGYYKGERDVIKRYEAQCDIIARCEQKHPITEADELAEDVIKYDFQILDDAYWLLTKQGYKIVRLHPAEESREIK